MRIQVKRLTISATLPKRTYPSDAGLDLYASEDVPYRPNQVITVHTDIAVNIPAGHFGFVRDRSSVSKTGLKVTAGIIDAGYKGEVCVVMINTQDTFGHIKKGMKIAQLVVIPIALPEVEEVEEFADAASERGTNGFGSSGAW